MIVLTNEQVRNLGEGGNTCLDSPARKADLHKPAGLYPCHRQGGNQVQIDAWKLNEYLVSNIYFSPVELFVSLSVRFHACFAPGTKTRLSRFVFRFFENSGEIEILRVNYIHACSLSGSRFFVRKETLTL